MSNEQAIIKRNRFFGIIIIAVITVPMALAYIMFHTGWGVSSSTTNKGTLLTPAVALGDLPLSSEKSALKELFTNKDASKKWRLLVPVTEPCNEACKSNLYITRQVHIRLAEKAYRVERILLLLDEITGPKAADLEKNHPNVIQAISTKDDLSAWLGEDNAISQVDDHYYLVDQNGFAMMHYDANNSGQDLLDDLKKLLKFTYDK